MVEHWSNAVTQAETAAHNMLADSATRRAHKHLPSFWSNQFGVNIKGVGLPSFADTIVLTQASSQERRLVATYGKEGRIVAAMAANAPRVLPAYQALIEARAPFPPDLHPSDGPARLQLLPAGFAKQEHATPDAGAVITGAGPNTPEQRVEGEALKLLDPRVPPGTLPLITLHANGAGMEKKSPVQEVQSGGMRS